MIDNPEDEPTTVDEQRLLDRLGESLGSDPMPAGMLQRIEGLLAFRDVDRELLELLQDTAAEPAGMRGIAGSVDRLTFELDDGSVSVELVPATDGLRGQVLSGDVVEVSLERLASEPRTSGVDALGRFAFDLPVDGPARLRLAAGGARSITTDWFLL